MLTKPPGYKGYPLFATFSACSREAAFCLRSPSIKKTHSAYQGGYQATRVRRVARLGLLGGQYNPQAQPKSSKFVEEVWQQSLVDIFW